jgi:D-proline reductase (dithiol) PrdB
MVRLADTDAGLRGHLEALECPAYTTEPWADGPPLSERRVAIISTAGLLRRGDRPFALGEGGYRLIRGDLDMGEMVMSHVSTNFDRSGFQQDVNVVFPIERLRELASDGRIGSVADYHYSFMGATDPEQMAPTVDHLAPLLKKDQVDAVLLAPV